MSIKLILADDHPILVAGVQYELAALRTLDIVGTASNSTEVVSLLDTRPCNILVTDYLMPGGDIGDGLNMLSFLLRRYPALHIIVFTTIDNPAMVSSMLELGIKAVLNKADDITHLITAIHTVYAGSSYLSPSIQEICMRTDASNSTQKLSRRELEVIRLFVEGASINEIANQLNRTKQTISTQKSSAMRKLGIQRDADLFRYAYESGLVGGSVTTKSPSD
ncbi:response regulator transcription factor [Alcaligenes phenolicus]|uniref:response regulator transcription factor n=1 Tax=Alcaligenes phenolicus TaxID=232846 RepID=UPI002AA90356|nr:response regulator transcription factor [Alcaligenes phenolicus]